MPNDRESGRSTKRARRGEESREDNTQRGKERRHQGNCEKMDAERRLENEV